jgi:hypothetical protein
VLLLAVYLAAVVVCLQGRSRRQILLILRHSLNKNNLSHSQDNLAGILSGNGRRVLVGMVVLNSHTASMGSKGQVQGSSKGQVLGNKALANRGQDMPDLQVGMITQRRLTQHSRPMLTGL